MVLIGIQPIFLEDILPDLFYDRHCEICNVQIEINEEHDEKQCELFQLLEEFKDVQSHLVAEHMKYRHFEFQHREWIVHEAYEEEIRVKYYKDLYFPQKSGRAKLRNKKRCGDCDTFGKY